MLTALIALAVLTGSDDPEAVIATAPSGVQSVAVDAVEPVVAAPPSVSLQAISPHGLTTAQQIDRWVGERAAGERPFGDASRNPFAFRDDRKMHGEVTAGIGTNDYSAFGARVSIPIGETGRIDLSYSQSKNAPWGYGYGYGYGRDVYAGPFGRSAFGFGSDTFESSPFRASRERDARTPRAEDAER